MIIAAEDIVTSLETIRGSAPLIHNITNYVVMNSTANALLALGASPVMIHAEEEVEEMAAMASALVINIGTLSEPWVRGMFKAFRRAVEEDVPVIVDPVGAGATAYRTGTVRRMIESHKPTIIRANASEMMALMDDSTKTKGVDSTAGSDEGLAAAQRVSERHGCAVCVSGATDYVVHGAQVVKLFNGHPMMARVTGLGCTATALCAAFAAVEKDSLAAAVKATAVMGIAGEMAAAKSAGPGSLQMHFYDVLYNLGIDDIEQHLRIEV